MLVEVGKTYLDRTGSICKVVCHTRGSIVYGTDEYFTYFPIEGGKENRERAFQVDRYGSHSGAENILESQRKTYDLVMEYKMPELEWVWGTPDKVGIWAYGGNTKDKTPEVLTVDLIENVKGACLHCWRCYLGPTPQIAQPKKPVKQTLWMVKYHGGSWEQLWLPDEEVSKFASYQDECHKTCTTRTV